jgi:hypothetical protein
MKTKIISLISLLFLITLQTKAQEWEFVGLDSLIIFHLYVDGDSMYAGTWDKNYNLNSGLYFSSDSGINWSRLDSQLGEGAVVGLEKEINDTLYIIKCPCVSGNAGTLYITTNNGQIWEVISNISNNKIRWIGTSPFNENEIYAIDSYSPGGGNIFNSLFKSSNRGISWNSIGSFPGSSHGLEVSFAFDLTNSMNLYVTVDDHWTSLYLFKSTDNGDTWFYISSPPVLPKEIYTDYSVPGKIYLTPKPYISSNGGSNWIEADSGLSKNSYYISFYQDTLTTGSNYILQTDGLYKSEINTLYWNLFEGSESLPLNMPIEIRNLKNITIDELSKTIYLGTSNGIYRKSLATNLIEEEPPLINTIILEQNFPNPFNSETLITYYIPLNTHVNLKVYDLLGNEIQELVDEEQRQGIHKVKFNNNYLSSGIYIYTLTAGKSGKSNKMTLLK